ncbi:hypothetical protein [Desulfitobacterium sp.]|uniref:hypothetical protein n=1 Tax=Desulfitobacterium sp. TaxID=49981 RepID=UPI002B6891D1|nr:hypothetical protein [Desulfitobacterium sp.]HVJ49398.1 hypothetical protein [Desulfitobacterium sp.]
MEIGTRSLLFGVHQFVWHPNTVYLAWVNLYGKPTWKEIVCIIVHDWGYFGEPDMDGEEGLKHPELGARIVNKICGSEYQDLILGHSRSYTKVNGKEISKLCWADKLSIKYDPLWLYLPRAWMSRELKEYRAVADQSGFVGQDKCHRTWLRKLKRTLIQQARKGSQKYFGDELRWIA